MLSYCVVASAYDIRFSTSIKQLRSSFDNASRLNDTDILAGNISSPLASPETETFVIRFPVGYNNRTLFFGLKVIHSNSDRVSKVSNIVSAALVYVPPKYASTTSEPETTTEDTTTCEPITEPAKTTTDATTTLEPTTELEETTTDATTTLEPTTDATTMLEPTTELEETTTDATTTLEPTTDATTTLEPTTELEETTTDATTTLEPTTELEETTTDATTTLEPTTELEETTTDATTTLQRTTEPDETKQQSRAGNSDKAVFAIKLSLGIAIPLTLLIAISLIVRRVRRGSNTRGTRRDGETPCNDDCEPPVNVSSALPYPTT